ncbi:MAG: hypothetical protein QME42_01860 [bacterium]|nr:hypothetical protein [bacterium]
MKLKDLGDEFEDAGEGFVDYLLIITKKGVNLVLCLRNLELPLQSFVVILFVTGNFYR